jgi:hypothetical protein
MATDVIYEEAVPVGLMTSSSTACIPSSGFIYARAGPVALDGEPADSKPVLVQPPKWTYCRPADVTMATKSDLETVYGCEETPDIRNAYDGMAGNSLHR